MFNLFNLFNRKVPIHLSTETCNTENIEYLATHSWERIMWYRAEMWRITMLLFPGLGALVVICFKLQIHDLKVSIPLTDLSFIIMEAGLRVTLATITAIFGSVIIINYRKYLNKMYTAAKEQNFIHQERIRHLSKIQGLNHTSGFRTCNDVKDTSYSYLNHELRTTLLNLKTTIATLVLSYAIFCLLAGITVSS